MLDTAYASIHEVHQAYKKKEITVTEVVLQFLSRIAKLDSGADGLKSVIEINPDAIFIAKSLDYKMKELDSLPPLFGIPILLKDNINTKDRMHTTAGSVALADNYAPYDAHIVKLLREAGALILGKANMTEFANYMSRDGMPSGYSSRGGQVLNPYNRDESPSGSSSGSAVAVAAGLCTVSIGTETSGSILHPAWKNGVVGIKPTIGLVSRSGIVPISSTHDTAGTMTQTVTDAAILLSVIAGVSSCDAATLSFPVAHNYTKYLDPNSLKGCRIGINRSQKLENFSLQEEEKAVFDNLCKIVESAGAILVDNVNIDSNFSIGKIMRNEFKACMNYYLSTLGDSTKIKTLKDIVEYNQVYASVALKYGQSILIDAENNTSGTMTEPEYLEALLERETSIVELDKLFDDNSIDIMLCETFTNIAPFTGFPSISIPIGQKTDALPIGSYWIARRFDEATLIKIAYAVEQALNLCIKPKFGGEN